MIEIKRNNNGHIIWTKELRLFIILHSLNISLLHRLTGIRKATLSKKLNEWGYIDRIYGAPRIYTLNENIFDNIDSIEKAYYLGLLAADGSVNTNSYLIRLSLHLNDYKVLLRFNNFIGSNRPIYQGNTKCKEVCINNKHMHKTLILLGIVCQKSYNLKAPNIKDLFGKAFVLGLYDGDGSIIKTKNDAYSFNIVGTKDILQYVLKFLFIYDNKYYLELAHRCYNTYQIRVIGNYRTYKLLENLYTNNFNYPMERKYERFLSLKNRLLKSGISLANPLNL